MNRLHSSWQASRTITKVNFIVGAVLMLVFGYISVTLYFGAASHVRFVSNDFPGAKQAATTFLRLSPLERHIGYFNRGTSEAAVGDFDDARTDLETALDIAPQRDECAVRINLAYVYEKLGDETSGQDAKKSEELYEQALTTLREAPKECRPDKSEEQEKSSEAEKRVEDKKDPRPSEDQDSSGGNQDQGDKDQGNQDQGDEGQGNQGQGQEDKKDGNDKGQGSGDDQQKGSGDKGEDEKKQGGSGEEKGKSEEERKRDELRERGRQSQQEQQQQPPGYGGGRTAPDKPW